MTETIQPEKMPLTSMDIAEENRAQLKRCLAATFPEIMVEDKIDLDQLRRVLGEWVEPDRERFGLTWPGKAACMKVIQAPSVGTLKPCRDESVDWDTTENLFIEGDNLEVLKLLQKAYFGKIKMIYIDPPYNTGKEFIYPDKYAETLNTYLEYTGQKDSDGRKFSTNSDTSGRFHSRWLSMMYPRLYLSKNLLSENGVIFVSIDDGEYANLLKLLIEIFGEENYLSTFIWKRKAGGGDDSGHVAAEHEYVICFARDALEAGIASIRHESPAMTAKYNRKENGKRYYLERLDKTSLTYNASMDYSIECPDAAYCVVPGAPISSGLSAFEA
jgi:adenine-specific DNA-methyltransferase